MVKKWLEDSTLNRFRNTQAIIRYCDGDLIIESLSADGNLWRYGSVAERINSIIKQMNEYLIKLARMAL